MTAQGQYVSYERLLATYIPVALAVLLVTLDQKLQQISVTAQCQLLTLLFILVLVIVIRQAPRGIGAATSTYLLTYGLFHFGLIAMFAVYGGFDQLEGTNLMRLQLARDTSWLRADTGRQAANLAAMGAVAFAAGCGVMRLRRHVPMSDAEIPVDPRVKRLYVDVGLVALLVFVCLFYAQVLKWGVLGASYSELLDARRESGSIPTYSAIAWALLFLVAGGRSRRERVGLGFFLLGWSPVAFALGLRGEVLFPLVAAAVLREKSRRGRASIVRTAIYAVLLLALVSTGRTVREVGVKHLLGTGAEAIVAFDPLMGLGELGGSLAPVELVVRWIADGDPYLLGTGYWAAFDHEWLPVLVPGYSPPDLRYDPRVPIISKTGVPGSGHHAVGFSVVADAYYNFGIPGVLSVMFLTGCAVSLLDSLAGTPYRMALSGVIYYALLHQIRNTFLTFPKRVAFGVLLVVVLNVASHLLFKRSRSGPDSGTSAASAAE